VIVGYPQEECRCKTNSWLNKMARVVVTNPPAVMD